jgi:tetratricopeptide (TPR) repeat protein
MNAAVRALWVAAVLGACSTGPRRIDDAVDPNVYTRIQDPACEAAWQRARAAIACGDDTAALTDLVFVARGCPDLVRAHLAYQDAARRLGGAAEQAMVDFYVQMPEGKTPVAAYCKARLPHQTAYAQFNALSAILARDPSFAWAHLSLARVERGRGRYLPALDSYESALVYDAQMFEARLERAQVLNELGRYPEAAVDYKAYLANRSDDVQATRDYVSLLLYRLGRVDEAIELLGALEAKFAGDLTLRMDRAAALWRSRRAKESAEAYFAILRDAPSTRRAALNLGLLYFEVLPRDDVQRDLYWPRARAAFRWFLQGNEPADGHEQFERMIGVPFRMAIIADKLGPEPLQAVKLDDLRWPTSG